MLRNQTAHCPTADLRRVLQWSNDEVFALLVARADPAGPHPVPHRVQALYTLVNIAAAGVFSARVLVCPCLIRYRCFVERRAGSGCFNPPQQQSFVFGSVAGHGILKNEAQSSWRSCEGRPSLKGVRTGVQGIATKGRPLPQLQNLHGSCACRNAHRLGCCMSGQRLWA